MVALQASMLVPPASMLVPPASMLVYVYIISRISVHMLVSHYNALLGDTKTLTGMVGTIDKKCDILAVCDDAYNAASVSNTNLYYCTAKFSRELNCGK